MTGGLDRRFLVFFLCFGDVWEGFGCFFGVLVIFGKVFGVFFVFW